MRRFWRILLKGSADDRRVDVLRLDLAVVSHPPDPGGTRSGPVAKDWVAVHRKQSARHVARLGRAVLGTLCLCVQLGAGPAPAAAQPAPRARIVLTYDPASEQQRQALTAVRAHLKGLPVDLVVDSTARENELVDRLEASGTLASSAGAMGTFSIEQGSDSSILVFFTEAGGDATLIRRLPPSQQSERLATEQAAIVVRSLVQSLLEGGRIRVAPAPAPVAGEALPTRETDPARPTPSDPRSPAQPAEDDALDQAESEADGSSGVQPEDTAAVMPRRLFVLAGYLGRHADDAEPWQSGVSIGLRWLSIPTVYVGARYTLIPATVHDAGSVRLSIVRRPAELALGYSARARFSPTAELSFIAEQSSRETLRTDAGLEPTAASSHWALGVGPRIGVMLAPLPAVALALRGGADFMLNRPAYATNEQSLLAPGAIRPRLDLEVAVGVW
jgi:hypothetical protein